MPQEIVTSIPQKKSFSSILLWAALIACLYLPTLATPFDFIDDGNLVYPSHSGSLAGDVKYYWQQVVANYEDLGPFRPTLWAHWRVEAELFNANPLTWRAARLFFTFLAAAAFLSLMVELRFAWPAAILTTALAMWNPFRNEIWTSLTLSEGVAMPYAIVALICALRAARSEKPWRWDIAGLLCMLVALGCKNTFAAALPAQLFFRVSPDGRNVIAGVRKHWLHAFVLGCALLLPVGHYLYFVSHWHAGQYEGGDKWKQFKEMLGVEKGAVSIDFMAAGYILTLVAVFASGSGRGCARKVWNEFRAPLIAGAMLLVFGVGIYLKIVGVSGRYAMPAVWGLDMWIGILLTLLAAIPWRDAWKRIAAVALCAGLVAVAVSNLGRQNKFAARARLLWQVVHYVEAAPPAEKSIAWVAQPDDIQEGIHIYWHLDARGYPQDFSLFTTDGTPRPHHELPPNNEPLEFALTPGNTTVPLPGKWDEVRTFAQPYWFGKRSFTCVYWRKEAE
ncbi:MAG TPA: hypothetical protein VG733_12390 [Chthoniobacteraceae bacterium]|nr:hypothetical protein [Chthoniobacteraceae bacterium]